MERIGADQFLGAVRFGSIIDVRSPAEFTKGHIPGAVNIPIFNNLERAKVGTVYKQQSREEAIALGLEIVGPKMESFTKQARQQAQNGMLNVYCWRGGMRSEKMAWLFETVGLQTKVLQGGYKAYRHYLHEQFTNLKHLVVLQGPTGSGKTLILQALEALGEQVLDLEGLAHHKGSAFGGLGETPQPTTQQFQNNILAAIAQFDFNRTVWVESESVTIGRVYLPETLWQQMNKARILTIEVPKKYRIEHIVEQYGLFSKEDLIDKISQLEQNMGGAKIKETIALVETGNLYEAVDLLLAYYDNYYAYSAAKYKLQKPIKVKLNSNNADHNARVLMDRMATLKV